MSFRLFIAGIALIIPIIYIIPRAYSQGGDNPIEQEFLLLLKEVQLKEAIGISKSNAIRILEGKEPQLDNPSDMDISLNWWKSSPLYNIVTEDPPRGKDYVERISEEIPDWPNLSLSDPQYMQKPISGIPLDNIPPGEKVFKPLDPPNLTWTPDITHEIVIPMAKLPNSEWRYKQKKVWWEGALISAAAIGGAYIFNKFFKNTSDKFIDWPPKEPICWTACAEGEPIWKKPNLPQRKMTPDEWSQEWGRWYPTPRIEKPAHWSIYARTSSVAVSISFASIFLYKLIPKQRFP